MSAEKNIVSVSNIASAMAASEVTVMRMYVVEGGDVKRSPWLVKNYEIIDGVCFIPLHKMDTGFCRFVTGSAKDMRDCSWLEDLKLKRVRASMDALAPDTGPSLFKPVQPSKWERRKQLQKVKEALNDDIASVVTIDLPAISFGGEEAPALTLKVKRCLDCKIAVSVELTADVLTYIRIAMLDSFERDSNKRQRAEHDGMKLKFRWCNSRQVFIAQRLDADGGRKLKIFRPNESISLNDAKDKANAWADGDSSSGDESDDNAEKPFPAIPDVQPA